jgi:RNA polymerase sigma-70 factor (ECF subfamily)
MVEVDNRSDHKLLSATPGDPEAFAVFYRRHVRTVMAFVARRAPLADVGDLVAEVFATALVHRRRFDPARGTGSAWLLGIAAHKIADANRRGAVEMKLYRRIGAHPVRAELTEHELEDSGVELLDGLPDEQRRAVRARVLDDLPYSRIAYDEQVSAQVVRKRVSRALSTLRTRISEERDG